MELLATVILLVLALLGFLLANTLKKKAKSKPPDEPVVVNGVSILYYQLNNRDRMVTAIWTDGKDYYIIDVVRVWGEEGMLPFLKAMRAKRVDDTVDLYGFANHLRTAYKHKPPTT